MTPMAIISPASWINSTVKMSAQVGQYEDPLLRFCLGTVVHFAPKFGVPIVHVGSEFEKSVHGVQTVDVEVWWSVEDA